MILYGKPSISMPSLEMLSVTLTLEPMTFKIPKCLFGLHVTLTLLLRSKSVHLYPKVANISEIPNSGL